MKNILRLRLKAECGECHQIVRIDGMKKVLEPNILNVL